MVGNLKTVTLGNPLLKGLQGLVLKFDDFSTIQADQVIMVAPF